MVLFLFTFAGSPLKFYSFLAGSHTRPALVRLKTSYSHVFCSTHVFHMFCKSSKETFGAGWSFPSPFQWCWSETPAWGRATCCPASPATSSTWRARAPLEWSSPHAASRWRARPSRLRSGTRLDRSDTEPSPLRKFNARVRKRSGSLCSEWLSEFRHSDLYADFIQLQDGLKQKVLQWKTIKTLPPTISYEWLSSL